MFHKLNWGKNPSPYLGCGCFLDRLKVSFYNDEGHLKLKGFLTVVRAVCGTLDDDDDELGSQG